MEPDEEYDPMPSEVRRILLGGFILAILWFGTSIVFPVIIG